MKSLPATFAILAFAAAAGAGELRDPMRPPQPQAAAAQHREELPVLSAVRRIGSERAAIFNGRIVHAGDAVGPYLILEVLVDGVRYRRGGATLELHLPHDEDSIKKPSAAPPRATAGDP